ncbi:hypothetical protein OD350_22435 [Clostridium beijerinckii]|uniref:hypothetical protein n=1 Tax=Clostridium beijerinckii TaxID=1520 RepID=UPI002227B277|nr:hypothetical protein [Clostridium beijerinckii]UYZ34980.1 hypothetical protein OD350_22435 [Clostridium beijerinckii]
MCEYKVIEIIKNIGKEYSNSSTPKELRLAIGGILMGKIKVGQSKNKKSDNHK